MKVVRAVHIVIGIAVVLLAVSTSLQRVPADVDKPSDAHLHNREVTNGNPSDLEDRENPFDVDDVTEELEVLLREIRKQKKANKRKKIANRKRWTGCGIFCEIRKIIG